MRFYTKAMRNASMILFWSAFTLFFGSFLVNAAVYGQMSSQQGVEISPSVSSHDMVWQMISAALNSWNNAMLPFFGAAVLWLLERKLPTAGAGA